MDTSCTLSAEVNTLTQLRGLSACTCTFTLFVCVCAFLSVVSSLTVQTVVLARDTDLTCCTLLAQGRLY